MARIIVKKNKSESQKRMEFSQRIVAISWIITVIWISFSFILAWYNKDTNSTVTVALISESFGVTVGYFIYQATLKNSRNKYGVSCDGIPYSVKQKLESVLGEDFCTDSSEESEGD